jgi:histidinol dehydrogenase
LQRGANISTLRAMLDDSLLPLVDGFEAARGAIIHANEQRAFGSHPEIEKRVREICEAVRSQGDEAVLRLARELDGASLEAHQLRVSPREMNNAWASLEPGSKAALERAAARVEEFHLKQPRGDWHHVSPEGLFLGQRMTPIDRVALYAPHGRAAYPSSVLMLAIPARVAGVPQRVLASPPNREGLCHPVILAAAQIAGVEEIYKVGAAVAVAALGYGTASIPRVDKIVGPGNLYFTLAKKHLFGPVGIDGLYGPSEVAIFAEEGACEPRQIALDLLAQAEHEPLAWVCFLSTSRAFAQQVLAELSVLVEESPRGEILRQSLPRGVAAVVNSREEACELCNLAAAEHVEIWSRDALALSAQVRHAGALFLNTPVPLGDYLAGPSHTLPTGSTARFGHGIGVDTFLKRTSLIAASSRSMELLADDLETIALLEELPGHAQAVRFAAGS